MKRTLAALLAVILLISTLPAGAAAETAETQLVFLPDSQISVAVPADYILVRQGDTELDSRLDEMGLSPEDWQSIMSEGNTALFAVHPDLSSNINVVVTESPVIKSLSPFEDSFLLLLADGYQEQLSALGGRMVKTGVYRAGGSAFLQIWAEVTAMPEQKMLQFMTVEDGKNVAITLTTFSGVITPEDEQLMERIVSESVLINGGVRTETAAPAEETEALYEYSYPEAGIHFTVPAGWEEKPLSQERQFLKYQITPVNDRTASSIIFGCRDFWQLMSPEMWALMGVQSKEDMESLLDAEMVAEMMNMDLKDVRTVEYPGAKFTLGTTQQTQYGLTITITFAFTIHDGIFIQFQMYDPQKLYGDIFEQVLGSVTFD